MGTLRDMDWHAPVTTGTHPCPGERSWVPPSSACAVLAHVSLGVCRSQPFAAGLADQT